MSYGVPSFSADSVQNHLSQNRIIDKSSSLSSEFNQPPTDQLTPGSLTSEVCDEALSLSSCSVVVSYHPPVSLAHHILIPLG